MEFKTEKITNDCEKLNTIKGFCNMLKATSCEVCEDCLTGVICFDSDDFTISTETSFRLDNYYEDIENALQEAKDFITYYETVAQRLEILKLLKIDTKPILIEK